MRKMATSLNPLAPIMIWCGIGVGSSALAQTTFTGTGDQLTEIPSTTPEEEEDKKKDVYTIVENDTLWSILAYFGEDPASWDNLWSLNDAITNPHWIYPGNKIVFNRSTLLDMPGFDLEGDDGRDGYSVGDLDYVSVDAECGPDIRFDALRAERKYLVTGFLAFKSEVEQWGKVSKARVPWTYLSEGDMIYLRMEDPDAFDCGTVVSIFRRAQKKVRNPLDRREKLGSLYQVVGEAKIIHRYGDYLTAQIRKSWTEIERGDLVGPADKRVIYEMDVTPPEGDLEAIIVGRADVKQNMMGPGETVFLNIGRQQGVREGNTFYVYEQRDPMIDSNMEREDVELPPSVIGRVMVLQVSEQSSTAVITDSDRSLRIGSKAATKID